MPSIATAFCLPPARSGSVEAGVSMCWHKYVGTGGRVIALDRFGASAPYAKLAEEFGYTTENVLAVLREIVG